MFNTDRILTHAIRKKYAQPLKKADLVSQRQKTRMASVTPIKASQKSLSYEIRAGPDHDQESLYPHKDNIPLQPG